MRINHLIRKYLIAGLLIWLPILVTILVIRFIIDLVDESLAYMPDNVQPDQLLGFHLPGLGLVFTFIILFITGLVVTNILGRRLIGFAENLLSKIPLVRSIYKSTKQVAATLFSSNSDSFRKVLLVEYPRHGLWTIGFQTGSQHVFETVMKTEELMTVFVPTTPNPTSGFLILVPKRDVIELDMGIDEALKMVISLGVVQPDRGQTLKADGSG